MLIVLFVLTFLLESAVVGRWGVRIVYADTWLSTLLIMAGLALFIVSIKNLKDTAGKFGVAIVIVSTLLHYGLDLYFNG